MTSASSAVAPLVAPTKILTAAHCVDGPRLEASTARCIVGTDQLPTDTGQIDADGYRVRLPRRAAARRLPPVASPRRTTTRHDRQRRRRPDAGSARARPSRSRPCGPPATPRVYAAGHGCDGLRLGRAPAPPATTVSPSTARRSPSAGISSNAACSSVRRRRLLRRRPRWSAPARPGHRQRRRHDDRLQRRLRRSAGRRRKARRRRLLGRRGLRPHQGAYSVFAKMSHVLGARSRPSVSTTRT